MTVARQRHSQPTPTFLGQDTHLAKTQADQTSTFFSLLEISTLCVNDYFADTLKAAKCQWKYKAGSRWHTAWCIFSLVANGQTEVFETLLWSRCANLKLSQHDVLIFSCWTFYCPHFLSLLQLWLCCSCHLLFMSFCVGNLRTQEIKFWLTSHWCLFGFFSLPCCKFCPKMFQLVHGGVVTHFLLCYTCMHVKMAAFRQ